MPTADTIRAEISREFGIEALPIERQEEVFMAITKTVLEATMLAVHRALPPEVQAPFRDAVAKGDPIVIESLMKEHIPNTDAFLQDTVRSTVADIKRRQQEKLQQSS